MVLKRIMRDQDYLVPLSRFRIQLGRSRETNAFRDRCFSPCHRFAHGHTILYQSIIDLGTRMLNFFESWFRRGPDIYCWPSDRLVLGMF